MLSLVRTKICLLVVFMLHAGWLTGVWAAGNGGYSGAFLRTGLGARGIGMGNAQVASADHGYGFYYNPAALPYLEGIAANFSYSFLSLDRRFNFIGVSSPIKPQAGFSLGYIYSGVGDITGYDSRGVQTAEINHGLHAIYFSFGSFIIPRRLSVGVNAKYLLEKISDPDFNYQGRGFGADLGLMFRIIPSLSVGYTVKDLNAKLKSNTNEIFDRGMEKDNAFPVSQRLGLFYHTPLPWARVAYDFEWSTAGEEKQHLGVELGIPGVAARLGYDNDHLTFGAGLEIDKYLKIKAILDYAFVASVIDEGATHIFSWRLAF